MTNRNKLALLITVISLFCFFPGIFWPMLTLNMGGSIQSNIANINIPILDKSSSILRTVADLWDQNIQLVSFLILLFSVIVPIIKAALLVHATVSPKLALANRSMAIVKSIGKWSMCDVFIVAIFLTHLSTGTAPSHSSHELSIMGFRLHVDVFITLKSQLEPGFYAFLGYCLLSLLALQIYHPRQS